ncbi:NUDIX domain-containing protein [Candidatus Gracilibacteria bacterium]|nr:NUDIX domain-containing protein [Candidatus Gracilibacteria bacterium]
MKIMKPVGEEKRVYSGEIIDVINQDHSDGNITVTFEKAVRSPGVRLFIINKENKILLTREYRNELDEYDFRLPGGKVFDTKLERDEADDSKIEDYAGKAAKIECEEETGLIANELTLFGTSHAGGTVEWDLYYFLVESFSISEDGQKLGTGEDITTSWYTMKELIELCNNGNVREDRSLGMIFKFLLERGELKY